MKSKAVLATWKVGTVRFSKMVAYDLQQAKQHALLKQHGYSVNVSVE